jgi:hypothetical protein
MSWLPTTRLELKTIVSPSGEWCAQPSIAAVLSAELEPGSDSRLAGELQSSQFLAAEADAAAIAAIPMTAGNARMRLFDDIFILISHPDVLGGQRTGRRQCAMMICRGFADDLMICLKGGCARAC